MAAIPVWALACHDTDGKFSKHKILRRSPGEHDVLIDIHYNGICHSDVHQGRAEWPITCVYPMVPGHEIAGIVEAVGASVTKYKVGDRVGVGCFVDSCRSCSSCKDGFEQYCTGEVPSRDSELALDLKVGKHGTYNACVGDDIAKAKGLPDTKLYGGYSQKITVDENYVLRIPDSIELARAGPLLCAGITMYSPLNFYGAKNGGSKFVTAIAGLGGLGAMGAKIAKAMGNEVYVLSMSERKREYVEKEIGCKFINWTDLEQRAAVKHKFDLIICTASADFDMNPYLDAVKAQGCFCCVGLPPNEFSVKPFKFIARRIRIAGSLIGGIAETQEMLEFCASHGLSADVEVIPAKDVNKAWKMLLENSNPKARYVLDIKNTLGEDSPECEAAEGTQPSHVHKDATVLRGQSVSDDTQKRRRV
eukprot:Tamp_15956.p1 GENE.Tamp_15956~~Tamp_15956.p1  ORF type:complete len:419 (+),score=89.38 Tamp_15956:179-1435(+)